MARLFGTDGVRGVANSELSCELAHQLGKAGAQVLVSDRRKPTIIVGRDPRASGDMLSCALMAGICSVGAHAIDVGVVTTPAIAMLVREYGADAGVMISASHNPAKDNGIKFFNGQGYKLSDALEDRIEGIIRSGESLPCPIGDDLGRIERDGQAQRRYIDLLKNKLPLDLSGLHLVLDCANGSASAIAPVLFRELGAQVTALHAQPDGMNINRGCGSTHPESLADAVQALGADVGLAFDGDADRLIAVDEKGALVDGDQVLVICATDLKRQGKLKGNTVVATVMSNLGLDLALQAQGICVERTAVGDRYVLENMLENGFVLGGEQSGHVIFLEHNTTGDGLMTAMQLLSTLKASGKPLSVLAGAMEVLPQVLVNVRVREEKKHAFASDPELREAIAQAEQALQGQGRVLVRPSGTEALVRIMVEGKDRAQIQALVESLAERMRRRLGD